MKKISLILSLILIPSFVVMATEPTSPAPEEELNRVISSFQQFKTVGNVDVKVPTVVEVDFSNESFSGSDFAVVSNRETSIPIVPHLYIEKRGEENIFAVTNAGGSPNNYLVDNRVDNYVQFNLDDNFYGKAIVEIVAPSSNPITVDSINVSLDRNVALPNTISIRSGNDSSAPNVVLAPRKMTSRNVSFPKTTAAWWTIEMEYSQPLRITEISLNQESSLEEKVLRFLAQPNESYSIYFDSDRYETRKVPESGNLRDNDGVIRVDSSLADSNDRYVEADLDSDGIPDMRDNCIGVSNPEQEDVDGNNRGDLCDDFDKDGVLNKSDNCQNDPNRRQEDVDGDGIGDACDGEESRITEKYPWLPWAGIVLAFIILFSLFGLVIASIRKNKKEESVSEENMNPPEPPVNNVN